MQPFTFFISYRRQDTAPIALLLKYEIEKRLQFVRVFVDVENLRHGEAFPERIGELIEKSHATIVLIGKSWMPPREAKAEKAERSDWIVTELEQSLKAPIGHPPEERYGLSRRRILPIFIDVPRNFDCYAIPDSIAEITRTHAEAVDYANWPLAIGPLIERIAVELKLKKRPDSDEYPTPDSNKARTQPLPDSELNAILQYEDYEGWYLDNFGNAEVRYLVKTFKFRDFNRAADFMRLVSDYCRVLDHHPEWRNVFNHVTVSLTTWDAKRRVTIYDLNLALFMNKAARAVSLPAPGIWAAPKTDG